METIDYEIIEACVKQAENLLMDYGEFYPFAFGMKSNKEVLTIATYNGNEYPSSLEVVENLKIALQKSHEENNFIAVSICINTFFKPPGQKEKMDALFIQYSSLGKNSNVIFPFKLENGQVLLQKAIMEEGEYDFWELH